MCENMRQQFGIAIKIHIFKIVSFVLKFIEQLVSNEKQRFMLFHYFKGVIILL